MAANSASVAAVLANLAAAGIKCFGPKKFPAQLEGSKGFTKDLCAKYHIPTGAYERFTDRDKALALAQLKTYAGKAQDILARASQIVAPLQSNNGHVIYRARFGLFAEQEARDVCNLLTQRGQTCFAAAQTR